MSAARRRALWVAIFWAIVGGASYILAVQSELGQRAEDSALEAASFTTSPPPPLNLVSELTVGVAILLIALVALARFGWRRALAVAALPVAAIVASRLLKLRVLSRPELFELDAPNTFPSGHMTAFVVLVGALIWAVPAAIRAVITAGGAVLLAVVGWQLLAYGWHRPSDVIGALAVGVLVFAFAALIAPPRTDGRAAFGRVISTVLIMSAWVLAGGALVVLGVAAIGGNSDLLLLAGQVGAFGASALASRALLLLVEPR